MEDLTGKQLGPYQIIEPLGEGGMAAVYKAFQPSMERYVALKILPRHFASDPEFVGRFTQEARVIANLQHPHILPVHDFGEADGYTYLTMRFIDGGTLSDWLIDHLPLPLDKIRRVIGQVGGALDYAHAQGVIHRDIKPSNILVDRWDNCLLTDFGLAKMVASSSHLTQTGGILGTPAYMSPEQGLGQKIDHRSDIYSLGVVLYQMAVGHLPYQAETPMAVVIKHIHDPLPPPRKQDPNLPESVELVILKALAKNPEERHDTAGDLVKALEAATTTPTMPAAKTPAAETAAADPSPPPPPTIEDKAVEPAPATVVLASSGTAVASPTITPESDLGQPGTPSAIPPASAPLPKKRRFKWRWVFAALGIIFACMILLSILSQVSQNEGEGSTIPDTAAGEGGTIGDTVDKLESDITDNPNIPESAKAQLGNALDAARNGDFDRAQEAFARAAEIAPDNPDIYCERAYLFRDLEMPQEAVADFEKCGTLAREQGNQELFSSALGEGAFTQAQIIFSETQDLPQAIGVFDRAIESGDAPPWLQCERGELILTAIGPDVAVVPDFEACAQAMADDEYWSWRATSILVWVRGLNALDNEDYDAAAAHFQQWANLVQDSPWPQCYLGYAQDGQGRYAEAIDSLLKCSDLAEDPDTQRQANGARKFVEAHMAIENGDWERALSLNEEAINMLPDDPWLFCDRAEIYMTINEFDPALDNAQTCLDRSGEDEGIRSWAENLIEDITSSG